MPATLTMWSTWSAMVPTSPRGIGLALNHSFIAARRAITVRASRGIGVSPVLGAVISPV